MKTKSKLFTLAIAALLGGCLFLSIPKSYANMTPKLEPSSIPCKDEDGKVASHGAECVTSLVDGCIPNACPPGTTPPPQQ